MDFREFRERYAYDSETDLLGEGGFGRVFRARDQLLNRQVALKIFSRDGTRSRYDLISEIRRAIDLNHKNICRYYGAEVLRGNNALGDAQVIEVGIMEFVEGGTLDEFLWKNPRHRMKLLVDVLQGLSYLHQCEPPIIHRDLKPPNVLVGFDHGVPVAKVTDFGISKFADGSGAQLSRLELGTHAYMAPEQFNPARYGVNGKIRCNVDLWAFGVMTIELVTGVLPFGAGGPGASTGQIMESILRGLPAEFVNDFEEPYRSVLRICMVQNAGERAQSAEEVLALLTASEQSAPKSRAHTVTEDTWKPRPTVLEKDRTGVELSATQVPMESAPAVPPSPQKRPKRGRRTFPGWAWGALAAPLAAAGIAAWLYFRPAPPRPAPPRPVAKQLTKQANRPKPQPVAVAARTLKVGNLVRFVAFSPDGRILASGGDWQPIGLWDVESGKLSAELTARSSVAAGLAAPRGKLSGKLSHHSVAFSPDGQILASADEDHSVRLWDMSSRRVLRTLRGAQPFYRVAFSPDGRTLASSDGEKTIKLWDVQSGTLWHEFAVGYTFSLAFSPDGRILASGDSDNTVKLWNVSGWKLSRTLTADVSNHAVAFSPDGRVLASTGNQEAVKLWDVASGQLLRSLPASMSVAFSPDGRILASGDQDNTVKLWDAATWQLLCTLRGHTGHVESVAFSPDGRTVASGSLDGTIKLWDVAGALGQNSSN